MEKQPPRAAASEEVGRSVYEQPMKTAPASDISPSLGPAAMPLKTVGSHVPADGLWEGQSRAWAAGLGFSLHTTGWAAVERNKLGFESQVHYLLAVRLWSVHLPFLHLSHPILKMGLGPPTS